MNTSRLPSALRLLALCSLVSAEPPLLLAAQLTATMVADIGTRVAINAQDFYLAPKDGPIDRDGRLYFYFDDGVHGQELWSTDGTTPGTHMVRDVCPGVCGARSLLSVLSLAALPNGIVFAANDGIHGQELWFTDGTEGGTRLVRDIAPGFTASEPRNFSALSDEVLFWADDSLHGAELWASDGTALGTRLVVDLAPGPADSYRGAACVLNDTLIFAFGAGLWRTDGTSDGTFEFAPVSSPYQNWTANSRFQCLQDRVVFSGSGQHGSLPAGLWVTDGTLAGTQQLAEGDFWSCATDGSTTFVLRNGPTGYEMWQTDGTPGGTVGTPFPEGLWPRGISGEKAAMDGALYFIAAEDTFGAEVWRFQGGGYSLLVDMNPGTADGFPLDWDFLLTGRGGFLTVLEGRLVFLATDGSSGIEPWSSSGVAGDAVRLADLSPGPASTHTDFGRSFLPQLTLNGNLLLLWQDETLATRLWSTDGSVSGSAPVADLRTVTSAWPAPNPPAGPYSPPRDTCFAAVGDGLLFMANDGPTGSEPWFSNGSSAGTHRILDFSLGEAWSLGSACAAVEGLATLLLVDGSTSVTTLASTSGAEGSLVELAQVSLPGGSGPDLALVRESVLYATGGLPQTDGTAQGTSFLEPDWPDPIWEIEATSLGLFFGGAGLALTDGSAGSAVSLLPPGDEPSPVRLTGLSSRLLFFYQEPATGQELWRSDGTIGGTALVKDILPGPRSGVLEAHYNIDPMYLTELAPLGPTALFAADDGVHGEELWRTDGTAEGTSMVRDIVVGAYPSSPRELTRVGDHVFFSAEAADSGREVWISDGTPGGTQRVADIVTGLGSSVPQELAAIRDELWFSAWTPDFGREPWRARRSGNTLVVERLADIAPGPLSSSPLIFRNAGADVFTVANDNTHGFELWKLRDPDLLFADDFESSGIALWASLAP